MKALRVRAVCAAVLAAALAPAATAYIQGFSGYLADGDVDTFFFTADVAVVEFEFRSYGEACFEVDVTRNGKYLVTFGVNDVSGGFQIIDLAWAEANTGNVTLEDKEGAALVRIKGGGEFYVAVTSSFSGGRWEFTWREAGG